MTAVDPTARRSAQLADRLSAREPSRTLPAVIAAVVAVVALGVVGAVIAVPTLLGSGSASSSSPRLADPAAGPLHIGQPIRTTFGALTVGSADLNTGLTSQDLNGMTHGVQNLVSQGSAQVNVVITLTNSGKKAVTPTAGQFQLLTGKKGRPDGKPVAAVGTTLQGSLPGGASVDGRLTFVTKQNGASLWLQYTEPGSAPIRVALGNTGTAKPGSGDEHHH